jgi:hypothetical protein
MSIVPTSISVRHGEADGEWVVEVILPLADQDPRQVTTGTRLPYVTSLGTDLWLPDRPLEFRVDARIWGEDGWLELAVSLRGPQPEAPNWETEPWVWKQAFRASLDEGKPSLTPLG